MVPRKEKRPSMFVQVGRIPWPAAVGKRTFSLSSYGSLG
jgi:hypothetical protein